MSATAVLERTGVPLTAMTESVKEAPETDAERSARFERDALNMSTSSTQLLCV